MQIQPHLSPLFWLNFIAICLTSLSHSLPDVLNTAAVNEPFSTWISRGIYSVFFSVSCDIHIYICCIVFFQLDSAWGLNTLTSINALSCERRIICIYWLSALSQLEASFSLAELLLDNSALFFPNQIFPIVHAARVTGRCTHLSRLTTWQLQLFCIKLNFNFISVKRTY